jgi:hypothetical protein
VTNSTTHSSQRSRKRLSPSRLSPSRLQPLYLHQQLPNPRNLAPSVQRTQARNHLVKAFHLPADCSPTNITLTRPPYTKRLRPHARARHSHHSLPREQLPLPSRCLTRRHAAAIVGGTHPLRRRLRATHRPLAHAPGNVELGPHLNRWKAVLVHRREEPAHHPGELSNASRQTSSARWKLRHGTNKAHQKRSLLPATARLHPPTQPQSAATKPGMRSMKLSKFSTSAPQKQEFSNTKYAGRATPKTRGSPERI